MKRVVQEALIFGSYNVPLDRPMGRPNKQLYNNMKTQFQANSSEHSHTLMLTVILINLLIKSLLITRTMKFLTYDSK